MIPLQLTVGDRDLSARDPITFSNTDPGGHEILQVNPLLLDGIRPGAPVVVRYGQEIAWFGIVNEPGKHSEGDRDTNALGCVGYAAKLKNNPYAEIYVDRDIARFTLPASTARGLALYGAFVLTAGTADVTPDDAGTPQLRQSFGPTLDSTATTGQALIESAYNANPLSLASLYYDCAVSANVTGAGWNAKAVFGTDDTFASTDSSANLANGTGGSGYLTATTTRRAAVLQLFYTLTAAGTAGDWQARWRKVAAYGTHGLTGRGSDPVGYYPSDIAMDALKRSKSGIAPGVIETASGLIVPHLTYLTPTDPDAIIDQMATLLAWHWGVWEPQTTLDSQPTLHFRSPPSDSTCVISRAECLELDQPKVRLDLLYDTAKVSYTDPAGTRGTVTVTISNPLLAEAGVGSRTLVLDMGTGTSGTATLYGQFALLLAQRTARGGGYALVGDTVGLPGGGRKPACLLKAGRDRLRITDLSDAGPLHEIDSRRFDTFHVRRVESQERADGSTQIRIDFDGGADLMEVLNARLGVQVPLG